MINLNFDLGGLALPYYDGTEITLLDLLKSPDADLIFRELESNRMVVVEVRANEKNKKEWHLPTWHSSYKNPTKIAELVEIEREVKRRNGASVFIVLTPQPRRNYLIMSD